MLILLLEFFIIFSERNFAAALHFCAFCPFINGEKLCCYRIFSDLFWQTLRCCGNLDVCTKLHLCGVLLIIINLSMTLWYYGCLNWQNDIAGGAAASQRHVYETVPYQSPDSQHILDNKKQIRSPELPPRTAHMPSVAASDTNTQMWACVSMLHSHFYKTRMIPVLGIVTHLGCV